MPQYYCLIGPIYYLESDMLQTSGLILVISSFCLTIIAQYQMSNSWRIGINYQEKTTLINTGLYKHSRNPVFLGVILSYFGTFLIIPNALSFGVLLVTFVCIQTQVRLEEEYLESVHQDAYLKYKASVRPWL